MKKLQKNISIAFFSLLSLTIFLLLFGVITAALDHFDNHWYNYISLILEIGLSIAIFVMALTTLISILRKKETSSLGLLKKNCLYLAIIFSVFIVVEFLALIEAFDYAESSSSGLISVDVTFPIIFILVQAIGCITLFLATSKYENTTTNKIFAGIGYVSLFITLILVVANIGATSVLLLMFIIFALFTNIIGAIQIITCGMEQEDNAKDQEQVSENPTLGIEQRLANLKNLHEQNLISDEEYNEKRKQIINSL